MNDDTGEIVYTPPDPAELNRLLSELFDYINNEECSLMKMALLHYQFESIHPFYDGNGRAGRILNALNLIQKNFMEIPILYLSSYIIRNKAEYYHLLRNVTTEVSWEEWILFILKGVSSVSEETVGKIKEIDKLLIKTVNLVKEKAEKIYTKELVESLFINPYCKIETIVNNVGVKRKAASRYLSKLVELEILNKVKVGTENFYINKGLMKILEK